MERKPDTEILIHISAPTRASDDARYRALAAAYLAFEPAETTSFSSLRRASGDAKKKIIPSEYLPSSVRPSAYGEDISEPPSSGPMGSLKSPQASFRSVLEGSPGMPRTPTKQGVCAAQRCMSVSTTQASWQTPSSVVDDSQDVTDAQVSTFVSPTRVLESYLQQFNTPSRPSKPDSQWIARQRQYVSGSQSLGNTSAARFQTPRGALETIPCSLRAERAAPHPRVLRENGSPHVQSEAAMENSVVHGTVFTLSSSAQRSTAHHRGDSAPPQLPLLAPNQITSSNPHPLTRSSSDTGPRSSANAQTVFTIPYLTSIHGITHTTLEIRAPQPPVSISNINPDDLLTKGLRKLAEDINLPEKFRPQQEARDLRPFERGYWLLDCTTWSPQLKRDAWAFLANYVGTGIAGWGVWVTRDADFQRIKLYCWGHIAAHVYYVGYLSSQREVKYTGTSWVDAEGKRVIVMGARSR
ncbi:hypothetical protein GGR57DRAFT_212423 [Xylariaceae sp. FL1272]|nr:hypothetical protein GGR57DRAFT_212423 [Xylariaceae sp. FL1272]